MVSTTFFVEYFSRVAPHTQNRFRTPKEGAELQWHNDVRWSCMYLKAKGYLVTTKPGIWKITKEGIMAF
ncbi:winged helix-turn-helix domain-containing protein [Bacillus sp. 105MF]|uniref:winged helix-turn-helix domain-containing protein n=1 Tax=Bacillus sp. 105MF TaxID=1151120 RepID=UPI0003646219